MVDRLAPRWAWASALSGLGIACGGAPPSFPVDPPVLGSGTADGGPSDDPETGDTPATVATNPSSDDTSGDPATGNASSSADTTGGAATCEGAGGLCHGAQPTIPLDGGLATIQAADVDRDGRLDLVLGSFDGLGIWVLPGDGRGAFGEPTWSSLEENLAYLEDVAVVDYTADGVLDVVVVLSEPDHLLLMTGDGDGSFGVVDGIDLTGVGPRRLAQVAFAAGTEPHLALTAAISGAVSVWLAAGGGLDGIDDIARELPLEGIAVAQLDDDGRPDLVLTAPDAGIVDLLLGTATGSFTEGETIDVGYAPIFASAADLDRDGLTDLVVVHGDGDFVTVWLAAAPLALAEVAEHELPYGVTDAVLADMNADGVLDLVTSHDDFQGIAILVGQGDGVFADAVTFASGADMYAVTVADLDADGVGDAIAVGDEDPASVFVVLSNAN